MVQKKTSRRGRPRAYDPDTALARALGQFWSRGYAATSLDDLSAATGMNRPSLYAAFGDKHQLYLAALERYRAEAEQALRETLVYDRPLRQALRSLYDRALTTYFSGAAPRGCFAIGTALTESVEDKEACAGLARLLHEIDAAFEARIRFARVQGEPVSALDPALLARIASAVLHTLAIRARAGERRAALDRIVDGALDLICGGTVTPGRGRDIPTR